MPSQVEARAAGTHCDWESSLGIRQQNTFPTAAALAGIGLAAGLFGAGVMLLSQKAEIALSGREPSQTPADAIEKLSGVEVPDQDKPGLSTAGHFVFGTALGLGLASLAKVPEPARTGLFLGGAWSAGNGLTTALGIAKPPTEWNAQQLATDIGHHLVYALASVGAFVGLRRLAHL